MKRRLNFRYGKQKQNYIQYSIYMIDHNFICAKDKKLFILDGIGY